MYDNKNLSLNALKAHHLIDADATLVDDKSNAQSPWFINLFFGFSGVLASLFFIGFLTLILFETLAFESSSALLITGLCISAGAFLLFKNRYTLGNPFMSSLALAISGTGQAYVIFALLDSDIKAPLGVAMFLLIQCYLALIVPNFIYRLLGFSVVMGGIVYLLNFYHLPELGMALLALITVVTHLQRYTLLQRMATQWRLPFYDIISAIAYASSLVLLGVSVYVIAATDGGGFDSYEDTFVYNYYLAQGLLTLVSLYATYLILRRYQVKLLSATGMIIICSTVVLGIMSIYVSGLLATSLVIVIATANSQRTLAGIAIAALVSYIFWYYYQLDTSLLLKSASMLIIGIGLLLMRWVLIKHYFKPAKSLPLNADKERLL